MKSYLTNISMKSNLNKPQTENSMFEMCANIDLSNTKIKSKNIFILGLIKSGKSTLYNHINNTVLMGVPPAGSQTFQLLGIGNISSEYKVFTQNAQIAELNSGISPVTLYPNIIDKGQYTLTDMAGFNSYCRQYKQVFCVSYALKVAFQKVKQCQFILTINADCFANFTELFETFSEFLKMFNLKQMSKEAKIKLFQSITFAIIKSKHGASNEAYVSVMRNFIPRFYNPLYGRDNAQQLKQILTYCSEHPQQIYLFETAVINKKSDPPTIVQDHFQKRSYFNFQYENIKFHKQYNKSIINLPFMRDFDRMSFLEKNIINFNSEIRDKLQIFPQIAKILKSLITKAISSITHNYIIDELNFQQNFEQMQDFSNLHDVYPKQFNNRCQGMDHTIFPLIFSSQNQSIQIKSGIILAQNTFSLYKLFTQFPNISYGVQTFNIQKFMTDLRDHLVQIIKVFKDTFCSNYHEEQQILKFLFIAVRNIHQFSILHQIYPMGKFDTCLRIKDSLEFIIQIYSFRVIQKQFVIQIFTNIQKVCQNIKQNKQKTIKYLHYFKQVLRQDNCTEIQQMKEYKIPKARVLQIIVQQAETNQEALLYLFQNFIDHKKISQKFINDDEFEEEDDDDDDQEIKFALISLLNEMGHRIMNLERADTYAEDNFAYDRPQLMNIVQKSNQYFNMMKEQTNIARIIFLFIKNVESVCKSYEVTLKNIPDKNYKEQIQTLKEWASYCSKQGRIEQSITLYQKALNICLIGKFHKDYKEIRKLISQLKLNNIDKLNNYLKQVQHEQLISPANSHQLNNITALIQNNFINPQKLINWIY